MYNVHIIKSSYNLKPVFFTDYKPFLIIDNIILNRKKNIYLINKPASYSNL